jgi:leader peptidase (prepilin peptidase)/N-methyltransferase
MDILISVSLGLVGLVMGSFAGATVWRLRARQLVVDKKIGEPVDSKELKKLSPLTKNTFISDRSRCLHCGYELRWFDLIPLFSWLSLHGKCRHCHKKIGYFEPLIELGVAALFVVSYVFWPFQLLTPLDFTLFGLWLLAGVTFAILFWYDLKWFLLPNGASAILAIIGLIMAVIVVLSSGDIAQAVISVLGSVGALAGLYGALYIVSRGRWIGFGDVKLGVGLGLILADWRLAILALIGANLLGTLLVLPGLITGKLKSDTHVPFGPLLITGTILSYLFGAPVLSWYSDMLLF